MNEFELINACFQKHAQSRQDVIAGIGDDAAIVCVPKGMQLLIATDTLVSGVHFLPQWSAYDIAFRSVMVNVSDIAAMGGEPCWASLALTLPENDSDWLHAFAEGLKDALKQYNIALIGGDTTKGPLTITLTLHGLVEQGRAVCRHGAKVGDVIFVTGKLGAAALAVASLKGALVDEVQCAQAMDKLLRPTARVDFACLLREYASSAIDISDGLSADLNHICQQSRVGAVIDLNALPMHSTLRSLPVAQAQKLMLSGGDDYELCFTVKAKSVGALKKAARAQNLLIYEIGHIIEGYGIKAWEHETVREIMPQGYKHF